MQLRKLVLGLAAVAMLGSCAKQITKAEAIKIAQDNYDSSNRVYKSAHYKSVTVATYSDNYPKELREVETGTEEGEITSAAEVAWYRLDSNDLKDLDEKNVTFKADGTKLELITKTSSSELGITYDTFQSMKTDEIGYILEEVHETKTATKVSSDVTYEANIKITLTLTWTK